MTWSLRSLLLGLTSIALVGMVAAEAALELRQRVRAAESQVETQTRLLSSAGAPLLLNALVVGDLATVEQTLRSINPDRVWQHVRLYEPDGQRLADVLNRLARTPAAGSPGSRVRVTLRG